MAQIFASDVFERRCALILANSEEKSYQELLVILGYLRFDYSDIEDEVANNYICQTISQLEFEFSIDKDQSYHEVKSLYHRIMSLSCISFWAQTFRTIDYAEYCATHGRKPEGILALQSLLQRLPHDIVHTEKPLLAHLSAELRKHISRLK